MLHTGVVYCTTVISANRWSGRFQSVSAKLVYHTGVCSSQVLDLYTGVPILLTDVSAIMHAAVVEAEICETHPQPAINHAVMGKS